MAELEPFYDQLSETPGWHTHRLDSGHDVMSDARGEVLELLLSVGSGAARSAGSNDSEER